MRRVSIFCGSNHGARPVYREAAARMGKALARRGLGLVYGGGCVGLMGDLADAALAEGGEVIGVIPQAMVAKELAHHGLSELRVVRSMHQRKALMAELADAFVALPGGLGTLEEFCEMLTWAQLGLHRKPCGLLNVEDYYAALLRLLDHAQAEAFLRPEHRSMVLVAQEPDPLLDMLARYRPPQGEKWLDREQA